MHILYEFCDSAWYLNDDYHEMHGEKTEKVQQSRCRFGRERQTVLCLSVRERDRDPLWSKQQLQLLSHGVYSVSWTKKCSISDNELWN